MYPQRYCTDQSMVKVLLLDWHLKETGKGAIQKTLREESCHLMHLYYCKALPMLIMAVLLFSHLIAFKIRRSNDIWPPVGVSYSVLFFHFSHTFQYLSAHCNRTVTHCVEKCYFQISCIRISGHSCFQGRNLRLIVVANGVVERFRWNTGIWVRKEQ